MARPLILSDKERAQRDWIGMKVQCPRCNKVFDYWYCPNCGLPKNNSAYGIYENKIYKCGPNHFRKEFDTVREYQLCSKCYTPNPYHANYCRNCGENITLQARDIEGHGWVDLGLSVLWSTETMHGLYMWMDTNIFSEDVSYDKLYNYSKEHEKRGIRKDVASYQWGNKWRIPTKEEFEELVEKCKWEKLYIPESHEFALKVIGPNGNNIILPATKHHNFPMIGNYMKAFYKYKPRLCKSNDVWGFWTSTETEYKHDKHTVRGACGFIYNLKFGTGKNIEELCILKEDEMKSLWLSIPFDKKVAFGARGCTRKSYLKAIRPVADKKWKGCL